MKKIAALQMLVNTIDPIIIKHNIVKPNIWASYCISRETLVGGFLRRNERQSLCVSLTKKVWFAFLIAVSCPGQVRLRAAGDRGSGKLLTTCSTVRLRGFEEPPKDPARRLGRD
jgi:hypothetical protein